MRSSLPARRSVGLTRMLVIGVFLLVGSLTIYTLLTGQTGPRPTFLYEPRLDLICYEKAGLLACTPREGTGISLDTAMGVDR